jgi:hypothetical protein
MPTLLWPRSEVVQLVIPQLASAGRQLSNKLVLSVISELRGAVTVEGRLSYDRWLIGAKSLLKWNDHCIQLFWDMLLVAVGYLWTTDDGSYGEFQPDGLQNMETTSENMATVSLEHLALFLLLHVVDRTGSQSTFEGLRAQYAQDTMWPLAHNGSSTSGAYIEMSAQPASPPSSSGDHSPQSKAGGRGQGLPGAPRSPTSRGGSGSSNGSSVAPSSPTRASTLAAPSPKSPIRSHLGLASPRASQGRSHRQHLLWLRQKVPVILKALALCDSSTSILASESARFGADTPYDSATEDDRSEGVAVLEDCELSMRAVDSLALLLVGARNIEGIAPALSTLVPAWRTAPESSTDSISSLRGSRGFDGSVRGSFEMMDGSDGLRLPALELAQWLDRYLGVNDVQYPVASAASRSPRAISPMGALAASAREDGAQPLVLLDGEIAIDRGPAQGGGALRTSPGIQGAASGRSLQPPVSDMPPVTAQQPVLLLTQTATVGRVRPTALAYRSATVIYVAQDTATPLPSNAQPSAAQMRSAWSDATIGEGRSVAVPVRADGSGAGASMSMSSSLDGPELLQGPAASSSPGATSWTSPYGPGLPHCAVSFSSRAALYLLSPYASASITSCSDCDIVLGAVAGVVVVSGCERVRLSVACRKLVAHSCLDCEFFVGCLTPSVVAGDCRGLLVAPLNVAYRQQRKHLQMAGLHALLGAPPAAMDAQPPLLQLQLGKSDSANVWMSLCDANACLDAITTAGSPSGYALDATGSTLLPVPAPAVAAVMVPTRFQCIDVPFSAEYVPTTQGPVSLPPLYFHAWMARLQALRQLQAACDATRSGNATSGGSEGLAVRQLALTTQFLDWVNSTGRAQQVLDLIRLDAKQLNQQQPPVSELR